MAATPPPLQTPTKVLDAAHLTLQPLLLSVVSVFALGFIIRRLGPVTFGQWAVGTALNAAVMFLVGMGLRPLFVRSVTSTPQRGSELLAEQLALRTVLGVLAAGIATGAAVILGYPRVIVLATALTGISTICIAAWTTFADYLQAFQRVRITASVTTAAGLVLTALSVTAVWMGGGAVTLAACYISGPLITSLSLGYVVRTLGTPIRFHWNTRAATRLLADSRPLALQLFLGSIRDRGEQLIVPKLLGIEAFGFFAVGMMPADRLEAIPDGLNTSYFTSIARSSGIPKSSDGPSSEIRQLFIMSLSVCMAAALAMTAFAPLVARILFREGGSTAELVMRITVWSLPLTAMSASMACVLQATGHHRPAARAGIMATIVGIGTSLTLIAMLGLPGAVWGVVVRQVIAVAILAVAFSRIFGSLGRIVPFGRITLAVLPSAAFLSWVAVVLGGNTVALVLANGAGLVLFGISLCVLHVLPWPRRGFFTAWSRTLRSAA